MAFARERAEASVDACLGDGELDGDFAADDLVTGLFGWLLAIVIGLVIAFFLPFILLAVEAVLVVIGVVLFFAHGESQLGQVVLPPSASSGA